MIKKFVFVLSFVALLQQLVATQVYALTIPQFPSCVNPQGTVLASYDSGAHGVIGNANSFNGSDKVFTISDTTVMQCLCPENGDGIQTNWVKASSFSDDDIKIL